MLLLTLPPSLPPYLPHSKLTNQPSRRVSLVPESPKCLTPSVVARCFFSPSLSLHKRLIPSVVARYFFSPSLLTYLPTSLTPNSPTSPVAGCLLSQRALSALLPVWWKGASFHPPSLPTSLPPSLPTHQPAQSQGVSCPREP